MKVIVHLHTTLQKVTPEGPVRIIYAEIDSEVRLSNLIEILGLDIDDEHTLFVVHGQIVDKDQVLSEGDEVHFIPAISGGCLQNQHKKYTL